MSGHDDNACPPCQGAGLADVRKHTDLRPGAPVPPGFGGIWPSLDGRCLSSPEVDFEAVMGAGTGAKVTPQTGPRLSSVSLQLPRP